MSAPAKRIKDIAQALSLLAPLTPFLDAEYIRAAAAAPHMRMVSAHNAVRLSMLAYIRHTYTDYDQLRNEGLDRDSALYWIKQQVIDKLDEWQALPELLQSGE